MNDLINSPGRSPTGKLRNFKAMNATKLAGAIADLVAYGEDPDALAAACAVAGVPVPKATKAPATKDEKPVGSVSDDPIGIVPEKLLMKGAEVKFVKDAVLGKDAIMEEKKDGHRGLAHRTSSGVTLYAGSGVDKTHLAPHLAESLLALPPGTWLDGEFVVGEGKGVESSDWGGVQHILGRSSVSPDHIHLRYVVFDVLAYKGTDVRKDPLRKRRALLEALVEKHAPAFVVLSRVYKPTQEQHDKLIAAPEDDGEGYEGTMVKWLDYPYLSGKKGGSWFKIKAESTEDVIVMNYKPGNGSLTGLIGAIIFGQIVNGELIVRGSCSGMDMDERRAITANQRKYIGRVFEIGCKGRYQDGSYRSPQFKKWRDDKLPKDCVDALTG